jgi:hypothetical protein
MLLATTRDIPERSLLLEGNAKMSLLAKLSLFLDPGSGLFLGGGPGHGVGSVFWGGGRGIAACVVNTLSNLRLHRMKYWTVEEWAGQAILLSRDCNKEESNSMMR